MNMRLQAFVVMACLLILPPLCSAQSLNSKVASYVTGKVGVRCGGGECAHAAIEALRIAGAEFVAVDLGADAPSPGDYVWGTLVKTVSITNGKWVDSDPSSKVQAGDIIQYRNTKFVYPGSTSTAVQHTSVVASVNSAGSPKFVCEQNFGGVRTVRKNAIDLTKLTAGYVRIYRPKTRISVAGQTKFTITNNLTTSQTVSILVGTTSLGSFSLTSANSLTSYQIRWVTLTGTTLPVTLKLSNGQKIDLATGGGYEVYETTAGTAALRKLSSK